MKKYTYSTILFLSLGIPFSAFSIEDYRLVDVGKYRRANPDPLDAIPTESTVTLGKQLGKGQTAVYSATVVDSMGRRHEIAAKPYSSSSGITDENYEQEVRAIQNLRNENVLRPDDLVSKVDGLRVVVTPKVLADGTIIMEKIQGMDGAKATHSTDPSQSPFANGYVDDLQKAIQRMGELLGGLNSLHELGLVHHDIKLENYMIEKRECPREEIEAKVEARARQMTGITGEEKDLTEEKKQILNAAKIIARSGLKPEDLYEFHIRIIDVGTLTPKGEVSPNTDGRWAPPEDYDDGNRANPADDMYRFATTLPVLLFGKAGNNLQEIFKESTDGQFANMRKSQNGEQPMTPENIRYFILNQLQTINKKMKVNTRKSYPEPVLMEFAQIMTDCLSTDPTQRPTAETVLRKVTHLALSNWQRDETGEYKPENTYKIEVLPNS
ncbi:MAG: hypothetical protein LBF34_01640 [Puniceicoccales bacterium]|jgi:serine/threonine protein kinase|nr:hypothetical protein [Puniceicoccales bacterium]